MLNLVFQTNNFFPKLILAYKFFVRHKFFGGYNFSVRYKFFLGNVIIRETNDFHKKAHYTSENVILKNTQTS